VKNRPPKLGLYPTPLETQQWNKIFYFVYSRGRNILAPINIFLQRFGSSGGYLLYGGESYGSVHPVIAPRMHQRSRCAREDARLNFSKFFQNLLREQRIAAKKTNRGRRMNTQLSVVSCQLSVVKRGVVENAPAASGVRRCGVVRCCRVVSEAAR
jgi:hypothetical protein